MADTKEDTPSALIEVEQYSEKAKVSETVGASKQHP